MTVYRALKRLSYRTSYSHGGRYYALNRTIKFGENGLWSTNSVWFSRSGTLAATLERRVTTRCDELVAETLVVPFCVIVHYVFGYRGPQVSLTERYEAVETLSTYGENESFRVCVQIRTIGGKAQGASRLNLSTAHVPPR